MKGERERRKREKGNYKKKEDGEQFALGTQRNMYGVV